MPTSRVRARTLATLNTNPVRRPSSIKLPPHPHSQIVDDIYISINCEVCDSYMMTLHEAHFVVFSQVDLREDDIREGNATLHPTKFCNKRVEQQGHP